MPTSSRSGCRSTLHTRAWNPEECNLQAELFETDYRPVCLTEYIKVGSVLYDRSFEEVRKVAPLPGTQQHRDPDLLLPLVQEVCPAAAHMTHMHACGSASVASAGARGRRQHTDLLPHTQEGRGLCEAAG